MQSIALLKIIKIYSKKHLQLLLNSCILLGLCVNIDVDVTAKWLDSEGCIWRLGQALQWFF